MYPGTGRRGRGRGDGFTLIELIVALSILGLVLTGVYNVFRATQDSMRRVDARAGLVQTGRVVLAELGRDLAGLYPLEVELSPETTGLSAQTLAQVGETQVTFLGENVRDDRTNRDLDTLRFTTAANDPRLQSLPAYDLCEVFYYLDEDETTAEEGLVQSRNYLPGLATEETPAEVTEISSQVVGLNFRYLDDSGDEPEWVDEWEDPASLPAAVEVTLFFETPQMGRRAENQPSQQESLRFFTGVVPVTLRKPVTPVGPPEEEEAGGASGGMPGGSGMPGGGGMPGGSGMPRG